MEIKVIKSYKNANLSKGLTVVIDVFRAFTTACYLKQNQVSKIYPVDSLETAFKYKRADDNLIVIGELNGEKAFGADFGNSPSEIENTLFINKCVVMATSAGTKGLVGAFSSADEVITGSFANLSAVVRYIEKRNPKFVTILCTDDRWDDNEDALCANAIIDLLNSRRIDWEKIKEHLYQHECSKRFITTDNELLKRDLNNCLVLDKFDFVLRASVDEDRLVLM